ncbi:MAG: hypothetical protein ACK5QZ_08210 [Bacteroidota bacterium]
MDEENQPIRAASVTVTPIGQPMAKQMLTSDQTGHVMLAITERSEVFISAIGFNATRFEIHPDESKTIQLKRFVNEINSVVITGQFDATPSSEQMAKFEYCFGGPSNDTSKGGGRGWTCEISAANNQKLIDRFTSGNDPVAQGAPDYNGSIPAGVGVKTADNGDHVKSTAGIHWMQENNPGKSFAVQAHLERAGAFRAGNNNGYYIEHIRDWNNAGPDVACGFVSQILRMTLQFVHFGP